jgi:hypothetical protein
VRILKPWLLPLRWQCGLLFAIGFAARIALVLLTHQYRDVTRFELQRTAYSLATTGVFGNPYAIETGPTAHVAPGYPLILAGIYKMFGAEQRGELVKEVVASAVSATGWALVPAAGAALGMPPLVGFLAGLAGAALPLKLSVETKGDWEASYSALATMWLTCLTVGLWRRRTYTVAEAVRTGAAWGVSLLFMPALLPVLLVFAVVGCFQMFSMRYLKFLAVQAGLVALILAPWIIRNERALGAPIATRTNFGLELRLSNNALAGPLERVNYENNVYHVFHPLQSVKQAERVKALGEVEFNREAMQDAINWIRANPGRFIKLTAERVFYFWYEPIPTQKLKGIWLGILALLGFMGLALFLREHFWAALPMALFMLFLPLPNYLVHVGLRHRFPLDWMCMLLAVYGVIWLAQRWLRQSTRLPR